MLSFRSQHDAVTSNHRTMFLKLLECVRYLARQGLPLRGHHENSTSSEGNLYQLLLLQAKDSPQLGTWLKKREYISSEIIKKVVTICGQMILRQLLQDIIAADYSALIADEGTDISHNEQMCIAVRWVDSRYDIYEAALGLVQLPDTKALTLFRVIKDVLELFLATVQLYWPSIRWSSLHEWSSEWCPSSHKEGSSLLPLRPLLCT